MIGNGNGRLCEDRHLAGVGKIQPSLVFYGQILARMLDQGAEFDKFWHVRLAKLSLSHHGRFAHGGDLELRDRKVANCEP
ncbi:MAG: hypothetical protein OHK0024_35150 [Thalassobaculales bacterium]